MGGKIQAYLDDDLYDEVLDIQEATGKSKSEIVNEQLREALNGGENWFMRSFGQSLFVIGFVIAYYQSFPTGLGTSFIGLGLMLWFAMREHVDQREVSYWEALLRTLGVH